MKKPRYRKRQHKKITPRPRLNQLKGCEPRIVDVYQVGLGNNGQLYLHCWQLKGCTSGQDYESKRIFRFDKIQDVVVIDAEFGERSQEVKAEGWGFCIGNNCFIAENICE